MVVNGASWPSRVFLGRWAAGALLLAPLVAGCAGPRESLRSGEVESALRPTEVRSGSARLLETGERAYRKHCRACHGANGDGQGEAAYLLQPKPRDFVRAEYRLVSTWEGLPTDEDLFLTISRGMPGSAMPSWAHLPEETRWGLVHFVKTFAGRALETAAAAEPQVVGEPGQGVIRVPEPPPVSEVGRRRGAELYTEGCAPCHGPTGRGDGAQEQFDSQGRPIRPRDLTAGVFKGLPEGEGVYRRIVAGLPGSPMPMSAYLHGDDAWHLARYVLEMSSPELRERAEMKRFRIVAPRFASLPTHPDDGLWRNVEPVRIHLMPLWWRGNRPEELEVKAVHDGRQLVLLLVWSDATYDHNVVRPQDFRDAAAVQFALSADPPFFAMGEAGAKVNIWMWKSERQADLEPAYQDLDKVYPNLGIDSYPNFLRSPLEQPTRNALTLDSDPTYVTAWGVGNVVSDPTRRSSVEDLSAEGFGTLRARGPAVDWAVDTTGVYSTGSYRVMFRRPLRTAGEGAVSLVAGTTVPVAFAVWDGSSEDRDGRKSVTIWQELVVASSQGAATGG